MRPLFGIGVAVLHPRRLADAELARRRSRRCDAGRDSVPPVSDTTRAWLAEPHEAPTVAALLVGFRDHMGRDWPSENAILATVERLIETPDAEYLLAALDDDAPAAVSQLRYRLSVWTASPDCWVEDVFVTQAVRRRGLGAALMRLALERAARRGCRRIELDANEDNAAALALYHRLGFSERSQGDAGRDLLLRRRLPAPG
jgi:GNAT superfamily N-acetyltransferase